VPALPPVGFSPSDRVRALAPVERVEVRVAESFPDHMVMHHFHRDFTSSSNRNGVAAPNATSINRRQPRTTIPVALAFLKRSWTVTANHNAAAHPIRNVNVAAAVLKRVSQVGRASAHMTQALGTTTQIGLIRDSGGEK
jgi:hypothetical protein